MPIRRAPTGGHTCTVIHNDFTPSIKPESVSFRALSFEARAKRPEEAGMHGASEGWSEA